MVKFNHGTIFRVLLFCKFLSVVVCNESFDNVAVNNFRDYLRINTSHPHPNYDAGIAWVAKQARDLNLEYHLLRHPERMNEFAVWLTWPGLNPELKSVVLYSHMDVVAVDSGWKHGPFGGVIDDIGNIYGRGAQDMKSAAVQYLEAIRNLKANNVQLNRTIHITFFPDEEVSGNGMKFFVSTPEFMNMNIGFVLDEGLPNEDPNEFSVYVGQRTGIWVVFTARGKSGHGSLLFNDTAAEKIARVINKMLGHREFQKKLYEGSSGRLKLGDVTTINLSYLKGGIGGNIVPPELSAQFDIRAPPSWKQEDLVKIFNETCVEAGPNVSFEILYNSNPMDANALTKIENGSWWWTAFETAFKSMNLTIVPRVFPAGSDGQTTRKLGIPTLGFSPIYNTKMHFHARDEYLNAEVFMKGIEIYEKLIQELATVPAPPPPPTTTTTTIKPVVVNVGNGTLAPNSSHVPTTTIKPPKGKSGGSTFLHGFALTWIIPVLSRLL